MVEKPRIWIFEVFMFFWKSKNIDVLKPILQPRPILYNLILWTHRTVSLRWSILHRLVAICCNLHWLGYVMNVDDNDTSLSKWQCLLMSMCPKFVLALCRGYIWNKFFWNNFEIISVFYFTCNHRRWLHGGYGGEIKHWNDFKIISEFYSHITTSETEIKLFQPLKEF